MFTHEHTSTKHEIPRNPNGSREVKQISTRDQYWLCGLLLNPLLKLHVCNAEQEHK